MLHLVYNIVGVLVVILMIPVFCIRGVREKGFVERIKQQLGFLPKHALDKVARKNCIWVHAASVGEIVAASPLIKEFHREFPQSPILVSVFTNSGYEMANRIIKDADSIIHFPFDLPWLSANLLYRVRPRVFMPVETELWPNFLRACKKLDIPVLMVNGRISDKSTKRYRYMMGLWDEILSSIKVFAMQSNVDAENILKLGADPDLVTVTGNTKFDQTYTDVSPEEKHNLLLELGLKDNQGVFLAGSTHKGEEEHVLKAFNEIRRIYPKAKLVIAPRSILRTNAILELCDEYCFRAVTRTQLQENFTTDHDVVILNTIGELGKMYSVGDVIFVGGTLIPHGGHNILEPAAHGKAIIVGENMQNFKDTHVLFKNRNAVITVKSGEDLAVEALHLFRDDEERHRMEAETLAICKENKGAAHRTAVILNDLLTKVEMNKVKATDKLENFQTYFMQIIHNKEPQGFFTRCVMAILFILSKVYSMLVNLKLDSYKFGILKTNKLGCFVISLGNITVGGTGKTPTAQRLAKYIRDMGYKVVILNRGYRAKWQGEVGLVSDGNHIYMEADQAGDEAYMLAKHLPEVPVLIGRDRYKTGQYAIEHFGAEVAILDDGFQHWKLARDLDVVLIDSVNLFGNGHVLPRGTLREPITHLERADVCLMTKVDQGLPGFKKYIRDQIAKYGSNPTVVESIHHPQSCIELCDWKRNVASEGMSISAIKDKKVVALSAIGNPASFEQTVASAGAEIIESFRFPDHHEYTQEEMVDAMEQAVRQGAEAIITTEKDAVKLPMEFLAAVPDEKQIPVLILTVEVVLQNGKDEFEEMLQRKIAEKLGQHKSN
ncbi:tetraacyldisaccharide 4'-kinase [Anaerovibrio lipolyticus]|uniref:tetraacyldisaccharide 4'-kinase n=1 Tax=Anaerovibrio lipolyticus TaxID=82374 RepID=UPI0026E9A1F7|nr:tetraacyldisaccharide 4'-kinase [Anaerovibrio lipolyticus]MBE6106213.1 tetraacyldisaccharide 4'-kinase [Anaerovibrio lipolyticus]